jgi:hypothetical protein
MSSGIDQPSFVYVDSKKDNFVKAPFNLLVDLSRLAARAAFTAARSEHHCGLTGCGHPQIAWVKLRGRRDGAAIASKKLWN